MFQQTGISLFLLLLAGSTAFGQERKVRKLPAKKDYLITIQTGKGDMLLVLSEKTPLHRANFVRLAEEGFYDGLLFHRVIENFMIQGGDPESKNAKQGALLGGGTYGERIPAEFVPELFHRKGALAAARDNNPQKASSGCQFYIVQGRKWTDAELKTQAARAGREITAAQQEVYRTAGGAPHLDGAYTVFGQVVEGLEVIDKIAAGKVDERSRPEEDEAMKKVSVAVWKKKKITKKFNYNY